MKFLLTLLFIVPFILGAQNMIYFEKTNTMADFAAGNGGVVVHEVGVHPNIDVFVKYEQDGGGFGVSTGWIPYTGQSFTDVYGSSFDAIGVFALPNDTLIKAHHDFSDTNYEITDVIATGFDTYGQLDLLGGAPWELQVNFTGPDQNCDGYVTGLFGNYTASNNILIIPDDLPFFMDPTVYYNAMASTMSFHLIDTLIYDPIYPTGTLLNAYVPRVTNRPATVSDCGGEIDFERVSMIGDVNLEYSINGSPFAPVVSDLMTGLCALDTIRVLGYSPTVMVGDTLVETTFLLRSQDSLLQYAVDISNVNMDLNPLSAGSNCTNHLEFTPYTQWLPTNQSRTGFLFNTVGHYFEVSVHESLFNAYENLCQGKYYFASLDGETGAYETISSFSFTILDDNNELHDFIYDFDIEATYSDTTTCLATTTITSSGTPGAFPTDFYTHDIVGNSFAAGTFNSTQTLGSSLTYPDLCPGLHSFAMSNRRIKYHIATDSLQRMYLNYDEIHTDDGGSDGVDEIYFSLPNVDTVIHYYEECTNNYSQPFTTIDYMTNITNPDVDLQAGGWTFFMEEFTSSFNVTQNSTNIYLPIRDVLAPAYAVPPGQHAFYVIAELYCGVIKSSGELRRRIVVDPDGTVHDLYNPLSSTANLEADDFDIYPNPVKDELTISSTDKIDGIRIIDLSGKEVYTSAKTDYTIDISHLEPGSYIIELQRTYSSVRKTFVKI